MSKAGKKAKRKEKESARTAAPDTVNPATTSAPDWAGRPGPRAAGSAAASGDTLPDDMPAAEMAKRFGTIRGVLKTPWPPGTLTVAMIVKDEAANIRAAIESFRPI